MFVLATIKTRREGPPLPLQALPTSLPLSMALGLHEHLPGFPILGLEQSEVATISNASFNIVKKTLELYNNLEA